MPISALFRPVHGPQQITQLVCGNLILLKTGPLMQRKQQQPRLNRIQLVTGKIKIAVLIHQIIYIFLNIGQVTLIA
ncbi:hypothetical protein D3C81_1738380 [compost metagenome]